MSALTYIGVSLCFFFLTASHPHHGGGGHRRGSGRGGRHGNHAHESWAKVGSRKGKGLGNRPPHHQSSEELTTAMFGAFTDEGWRSEEGESSFEHFYSTVDLPVLECNHKRKKNVIWLDVGIISVSVEDEKQCASVCFMTPECKAAGFGTDDYGNFCELYPVVSEDFQDEDLFSGIESSQEDAENFFYKDYIYKIKCGDIGETPASTERTTVQTNKPTTTTKKPEVSVKGQCGIGAKTRLRSKLDGMSVTVDERLTPRIVGGTETLPNAWPWLVWLQKPQRSCGGSLVRLSGSHETTDIVITAEHCILSDGQYVSASGTIIIAGEYDRSKTETTEQMSVGKDIYSPKGLETDKYRDIAIIVLQTPIDLSRDGAKPVCLPKSATDDPPIGKNCVATGWDTLQFGASILPQKPYEVVVPVTECGDGTSDADICAGLPEGGKDACQGDSGVPYMCELEPGKWTLSGVVSRGNGCGDAGHPGVYARVSYNLDWIKKTICAHSALVVDGC